MKAYVIKRDDGKYYSRNKNYDYRLKHPLKGCWTDNIFNAMVYKQEPTTTYQVVPVTIIEGDLEDHDKQVRNELINKIKYQVERQEDFIDLDFCYQQGIKGTLDLIKSEKVLDILDQLKGEKNE